MKGGYNGRENQFSFSSPNRPLKMKGGYN